MSSAVIAECPHHMLAAIKRGLKVMLAWTSGFLLYVPDSSSVLLSTVASTL